MWRVGRHRLAWRPARQPGLHPYRPLRSDQSAEIASWLAAVLATIVVLLWRALSNRWPVIVYQLVPMDEPGQARSSRPLPRAEANELIRTWASHIERYGKLPEP